MYRKRKRTWDGFESGSAQRTDFTLATAPLAASTGQPNHNIPSFPVCTPYGLQHLLWDRAAEFSSHGCHFQHFIFPHLGLIRVLLARELRDGVFVPWIKNLLSNKSYLQKEKMHYIQTLRVSKKIIIICTHSLLSYLSLHFSSSENHHMWRWQPGWTLFHTVSPHRKRSGPRCSAPCVPGPPTSLSRVLLST